MNEWTLSTEHPGYRCKTIERGNFTVTILRPELAPEERARREAHIKAVAENALKNYIYKGDRT